MTTTRKRKDNGVSMAEAVTGKKNPNVAALKRDEGTTFGYDEGENNE